MGRPRCPNFCDRLRACFAGEICLSGLATNVSGILGSVADLAVQKIIQTWAALRLRSIPMFAVKLKEVALNTLMILVAGPYRSGTNDDPALIARNVEAMTETSLRLFRAGHLPVMGEWFALPLLEHAGSKSIGDTVFNEIFHPVSRRLVAKCDACLRIGGPPARADDKVALARQHQKAVYFSLEEIPSAA
jgi:hypothetical protein